MIPRLVTETQTKSINVPRTVIVNQDVQCKVSNLTLIRLSKLTSIRLISYQNESDSIYSS